MKPATLADVDVAVAAADTILRADGTLEALPGCTDLTLAPGDILTIATPGGGDTDRREDADALYDRRDDAVTVQEIERIRV